MYLFVEVFSKDKALLSDFLEHYYVRLKWIANPDGSFINGSSSHETAKIAIRVPVDRGSRANVYGTENRRCARTDSADSKKNLPVSTKVAPVLVGPDLLAPLHKSNLTLAGRKIQK
jgi:hypothetical protein